MSATVLADPFERALDKAWNYVVKGTYSETDKKVFKEGFREGWYAGRSTLREEEATRATNCKDDCHYVE